MNVLFVTVGTSAITNAHIGKAPDSRDNSALRKDVLRYEEDQRKERTRWEKLKRDLVAAHLRYWSGMDLSYTTNRFNFSQSSAELTSTFCVLRDLDFKIHRIVLLPTDTPEGRLACEIVHEVMTNVAYDAGVVKDQIFIEHIPGLEIEEQTIEKLRNAVSRHTKSANDRRVVNVTGGYKGTALLFGRLTAKEDYIIYYQHDSLPRPVWMRDLKACPNSQ